MCCLYWKYVSKESHTICKNDLIIKLSWINRWYLVKIRLDPYKWYQNYCYICGVMLWPVLHLRCYILYSKLNTVGLINQNGQYFWKHDKPSYLNFDIKLVGVWSCDFCVCFRRLNTSMACKAQNVSAKFAQRVHLRY